LEHWIESVARAVEAVGVLLIVAGMLVAAGRYGLGLIRALPNGYTLFRQDLGRAILLGLEFLVAADIIHTVGVAPTLQNVLVLGVVVLIRTFLSMTLHLEIEGRWPWQKQAD
jgi:uncharacterized membrane protein